MSTVRDLLTANLLHVFDNRDAEARARAIAETYTEDVEFTDPDGTVVGREELGRRAAGLLDSSPADFVFAEAGPAYTDDTAGALAWTFGPAGGSPAARGVDVITVRDGRIATLRTLLAGGAAEA